MHRLDHVNRSRELGVYLGAKLHALKEKRISIGKVRGLGLFWAIELVENCHTRKPSGTKQDKVDGKPTIVDRVAADLLT